jgi:hypothetical protein
MQPRSAEKSFGKIKERLVVAYTTAVCSLWKKLLEPGRRPSPAAMLVNK